MPTPETAAPPFSIGATLWPGLTKAAEESGELVQVIAKLMATGGAVEHWDGTNLRDRLTEELADVLAAVYFVVETNSADSGLDLAVFYARVDDKLALFRKWHDEQRGDTNAA